MKRDLSRFESEVPPPRRPGQPKADKPAFPRGVADDWFVALKRRADDLDAEAISALKRFAAKQEQLAADEEERIRAEAWRHEGVNR